MRAPKKPTTPGKTAAIVWFLIVVPLAYFAYGVLVEKLGWSEAAAVAVVLVAAAWSYTIPYRMRLKAEIEAREKRGGNRF